MVDSRKQALGSLLALILMASGCFGPFRGLPGSGKNRYPRAEEYFDDAQSIAVCKAVDRGDLKELQRLIDAGANVNVKGKGNMTFLLRASTQYGRHIAKQDGKETLWVSVMEMLLKADADPNVVTTRGLHKLDGGSIGESFTHLSVRNPGKMFDLVFEHGGDPNLFDFRGNAPLHEIVGRTMPTEEKHRRIDVLIGKGANLDAFAESVSRYTPCMRAVSVNDFEAALYLLRLGADPTVRPDGIQLRHLLRVIIERNEPIEPDQAAARNEVVNWLNAHGQSMQEAEEDHKQWVKLRELPELGKAPFRRKLEATYPERDKRAREAWQQALAEDRRREAEQKNGKAPPQ